MVKVNKYKHIKDHERDIDKQKLSIFIVPCIKCNFPFIVPHDLQDHIETI